MEPRVQRAGTTDRVPRFWYEENHVVHRFPDGTIEYIGFECRHTGKENPRILS